jgi:hypothetical protein
MSINLVKSTILAGGLFATGYFCTENVAAVGRVNNSVASKVEQSLAGFSDSTSVHSSEALKIDKSNLPFSDSDFDPTHFRGYVNVAFVMTGEVPSLDDIPYELRIARADFDKVKLIDAYASIVEYLNENFDEPSLELKLKYAFLSNFACADSAVSIFISQQFGISKNEFKSMLDLFRSQPGVM